MTSLEEVLSKAVKDSASDIFIVAGGYLSYKVDGEIRSMDESMKLTPTETSYFIDEIYSFAKRSKEYYLQQGDDDFSFAIGKLARFRVNTYMQRGSQAAVIRVVAFDIPDYKELDIPDGIKDYEGGIIDEKEFLEKLPEVAKNAIGDACTGSNPRQPSQEEMEKLLKCCFYDTEVDF